MNSDINLFKQSIIVDDLNITAFQFNTKSLFQLKSRPFNNINNLNEKEYGKQKGIANNNEQRSDTSKFSGIYNKNLSKKSKKNISSYLIKRKEIVENKVEDDESSLKLTSDFKLYGKKLSISRIKSLDSPQIRKLNNRIQNQELKKMYSLTISNNRDSPRFKTENLNKSIPIIIDKEDNLNTVKSKCYFNKDKTESVMITQINTKLNNFKNKHIESQLKQKIRYFSKSRYKNNHKNAPSIITETNKLENSQYNYSATDTIQLPLKDTFLRYKLSVPQQRKLTLKNLTPQNYPVNFSYETYKQKETANKKNLSQISFQYKKGKRNLSKIVKFSESVSSNMKIYSKILNTDYENNKRLYPNVLYPKGSNQISKILNRNKDLDIKKFFSTNVN